MFIKFVSETMETVRRRLHAWNEVRKASGKFTFGRIQILWKLKWLRNVLPERWLYEWKWRFGQWWSERCFWEYLEEGHKRFGYPLSGAEKERLEEYERQYVSVIIHVMVKNAPILGLCVDYMLFSEDSRNDDEHVLRLLFHEGEFDQSYNSPNNYLSNKFDEMFERITKENCSFWYVFLTRNQRRVKVEFTHTYLKRQYDEALLFPETRKAIMHRSVFSFSETEEKEGEEALRLLGISEPYICIFARDGSYNAEMRKLSPVEKDSANIRNMDINAFKIMTRYFWDKGIQSVRMGAVVASKYQCEGAIDYANIGRKEFLDVYIFSKCMFFIGALSGIAGIPIFFGRPVVFINLPLAVHVGDRTEPMALGIFLKYYDPIQKRYLRWREWCAIMQKFAENNFDYTAYMRQHYEIIYNTPEEISEVAKEMEMICNHTMHYTEYDEMLQQRYLDLVRNVQSKFPVLACMTPGRIGRQWLHDNEWFLE